MGAVCAGAQEHRRRARAATAHPVRLRARRTDGRCRAAARVAQLRRRWWRAYRCRARGYAAHDRAGFSGARLSSHRGRGGACHAARGRRANSSELSGCAVRAGATGSHVARRRRPARCAGHAHRARYGTGGERRDSCSHGDLGRRKRGVTAWRNAGYGTRSRGTRVRAAGSQHCRASGGVRGRRSGDDHHGGEGSSRCCARRNADGGARRSQHSAHSRAPGADAVRVP